MRKKSDFSIKQLENLGKRIRALRKLKGYKNADFFAYDNMVNMKEVMILLLVVLQE